MKNLEIIDKSIEGTCNKCEGKGCKQCYNGIYKDENYILITKDETGKKIAFQSDFRGK